VELAVLAIPIFMMIVGIWEVGRLVQMEQVLLGAVREAARQAAQGYIVTPKGKFTAIYTNGSSTVQAGTLPGYLDDTVIEYLTGAGVTNTTNLKVEFYFLDASGNKDTTAGHTEPYQGKKGDKFKVYVWLPYDNFRWTTATFWNTDGLGAETIWFSLADKDFTLDTSVPGWSP